MKRYNYQHAKPPLFYENRNLLNNACIVDESGKRNFPETSTISFGSAATIKAKGMFVGKVAAEISWNGKAHVLKNRWDVMLRQSE